MVPLYTFYILVSLFIYDIIENWKGDKMSRNSNESILKYQKKAYEDIRLRVKRGEKDIIKAHAESKGMSLNAYINDLIEKDMKENEKWKKKRK